MCSFVHFFLVVVSWLLVVPVKLISMSTTYTQRLRSPEKVGWWTRAEGEGSEDARKKVARNLPSLTYWLGKRMQTWGVFFKPGFTGLTASKPGYPGLIMSVRRAVGSYCSVGLQLVGCLVFIIHRTIRH